MKKIKFALAGILLISIVSCRKADPGANIKPLLRVVSTYAGGAYPGFADGTGTNSAFNHPYQIVVDTMTGNIFVADEGNGRVRKISAAGVVTTLAGTGTDGYQDGPAAQAQFNKPVGVTVDKSGNVFVVDNRNNCIRKITPAGMVSTFAGGIPGYADGTGTNARFNYPLGIAIDATGNLYVCDLGNVMVRKISPAGQVTTLAGAADGLEGAFSIAVDASGNICVGDNYCIRKITPGGTVSYFSGGTGYYGYGYADGAGPAARMYGAYGLTADNKGNLFIADQDNQVVRKVSPDGYMSTYAGIPNYPQGNVNPGKYHKDGLAEEAMFYWLHGVACDNKGNVFVAEGAYSGCIRKISEVTPPDTPEEAARKNWNKPNKWN